MQHLESFREVLKNYHVSEDGKRLLTHVQLVLLAAPTSSGRNTIIKELLKSGNYHYIVSDTTRQPRMNDGEMEQNGVQYWFRSENDMLADLQAGKYLEAALIHNQQVSGISLREIEAAQTQDKIAITDIEIAGVEKIVAAKPDATVIFVVSPSFDEWQRRIFGRGKMENDEYKRRLASSLKEFQHALQMPYYHFVINDSLSHAVAQIDALAKNPKSDPDQQAKNRGIVEEICRQTEQHLVEL